ncbi:diaminopimelate epimerase [Thioclava sp. L04-15]|uniref:diaminopimelate epimerase n=1 Tax=Thioclava sp. L04-15 TaxID=1915318 RepID=UPI0009968AC2|nr:diaminopimelate epimerase [Thioclava sp. L04-15]OOY29660.1 diaminopimelate epimerase [Thioclava sp. L04-15]TNE94127.1 MAG: diaminopimelate epimerase [Paracoccaceae bacterium]
MNTARTASGLPFMKMHGLGNDFVVIDARKGDDPVTPALARALGDRHRGVGFDQLAVIRPAQGADFTLDFWNSDGSRAGACGNATRCVSDYMMRQLGQDRVTLLTERGELGAVRRADGMVSVNMGAPILDAAQIPVLPGNDPAHLPLEGDPIAVGMGNPHCVFFVEDANSLDPAARGPAVEHDALFPERTNVEFASLIGPDHLRMRVWERGTGITLACGSGTCATAVAANLRGLTGKHVLVDVDGGQLEIDWREDGVWMTGPTAHVFDATLTPEFLASL